MMTMTKKTTQTNDINVVTLPASTATNALYFLQRVVVHGNEQTELFNVYQSLSNALNIPSNR